MVADSAETVPTSTPLVSSIPVESVPVASSTTAGAIGTSDREWLRQETSLFLTELEESGKVLGPSQGAEQAWCAKLALTARRTDMPSDQVALGTVRLFYEDRSQRPQRDTYDPQDDLTRPEFRPPRWGVLVVVLFDTPEWQGAPNWQTVAAELMIVSFGVGAIVEGLPRECFIVDVVDAMDALGGHLANVDREGG